MEIKIVCSDDKYLPKYSNPTDACMDLKIRIEDESMILPPKTSYTFGTGIKVSVPKDHVMVVYPRSSTGIRFNVMLANSTGIIDSGYRDEVKLCLYNFGDNPVLLEDGQRVAQFMVIPRPKLTLDVVPDNQSFRTGDRGGGIGSTGK